MPITQLQNKLKFAAVCLAIGTGSVMTPASAEIITFEDTFNAFDFEYGAGYSYVAPGYHGFNLTGGRGGGSWVMSTANIPTFALPNAHSGILYAFSNGGTDMYLNSASGQFKLNDFWARSGDTDTSYNLLVTAYKGSDLVFSQNLSINGTYQQYSMNLSGIDSVHFSTNRETNLLLDDISVNDPTSVVPGPAAPVPEPESWGMLAAGLAVLAGLAQRRKRG